jgi:hypothetical protein
LARTFSILALLACVFVVVSPASGGQKTSSACGAKEFSYAGLQNENTSHGVSASLVSLAAPTVVDGHVGGWIGVTGDSEWIQTGFASFAPDSTIKMYYEVSTAGAGPRYVELSADVSPGEKHTFSVLEMSQHDAWWRVWVDGRPVSPPIHLAGSHDRWYPQAMAENWNGGTGACNSYSYRFANIRVAHDNGGVWRPLQQPYMTQDPGYRVVTTSRDPMSFLAKSLTQ